MARFLVQRRINELKCAAEEAPAKMAIIFPVLRDPVTDGFRRN